jgi:FkbM family methyltransferase
MFNFKSKSKLIQLLEGPRYISGKYIDRFGNVFYYPDQQSFAWTYIELFEKQTYYFKMLNKNETPFIIDCGANIGVSIIYFKSIFPNCKILAFEPDPFLFEYLERNIAINKLKDIEIYQKAVWDKETIIEFFQEKSDSGRLSLNSNLEMHKSTLIEVDSCLLSDYISTKVDFLKVDIEGSEWPVVKEIEEKLKFVERIFIESHSFIGDKQDAHKILKLLSDNNFRYFISEGAVSTSNPFLEKKQYLNMDLQINIHAYRE